MMIRVAAVWACALPAWGAGGGPDLSSSDAWTPAHDVVHGALLGEGLASPVEHADVVSLLVVQGGEVLAPLLDIAAGRLEPPVTDTAGPRRPPVVRPDHIARDVIATLDSTVAIGTVLTWCGDDPSLTDVLNSLRFLETVEDQRALDLMLQLLSKVEPVHLRRPFVRSQVVASLAGATRDDENATWFLTRAAETLDPPQLGIVVELQGGARGMEGVKLLRQMLDLDPELDRAVVEALGIVSSRELETLRRECIDLVRPELESRSSEVRGAAIVSLGRLGDHASIPSIVDQIHADQPILSIAADRALRELAGQAPAGVGAWKARDWTDWYIRELSWYEREMPRLVAIVNQARPAPLIDALREMVAHPLFRAEAADLIEELLWHPQDEIVVVACTTLGQLGWAGALDGLTEALEHSSEKVRAAAHGSLCALSGEVLPAEADAWRAWLAQ